jgi:putative inorganic carbon (HCO3(-)) transporter
MMAWMHRVLLAVVLVGNMILFAGVDPVSRAVTALLAVLLVIDMRRVPLVPRLHRIAGAALFGLVVLQLLPLPVAVRGLLQPGFAEVMAPGWAPLSLAPWATVWSSAAAIIALVLMLTAARMATTRSGAPALLIMIAATGTTAAILGLLAEGADPSQVLGLRDNVQGGGPYGSFVNHNHFAQAMELTIPAAVALFIAASRRLPALGLVRQKAVVVIFGATVAIAVSSAALLRSGSRAGTLLMIAAAILTAPWWRRNVGPSRLWPKIVAGGAVVALIASLSWTRMPDLKERLSELLVVEGLQGNSRIDLWLGTLGSWQRAPTIGSGLGSYRYVIGLDKPATGAMVLEQAHNDWLEWASTTGLVGVAILGTVIAGLAGLLWPSRIRRFRSDLRYPLAAAMLALTATALHEVVGFGLQTPVNRYLLAVWIGLVWGLWERVRELEKDTVRRAVVADEQPPDTVEGRAS